MKNLSPCILIIPLFLPISAKAQNFPNLNGLLDITHESTIAEYGFYGSTAAIQFGDGTRWTDATGTTGPADASQGGRDLQVDDRFHIGSQTKTYTGTVVLKFVDDGIINLEDTLQDWYAKDPVATAALSVMPKAQREFITVRDLLSMRTGIAEYLGGEDPNNPGKTILDIWNENDGNYDLTREQLLTASLGLPQTMTPGDQNTFEYSNANFMLAGIIAEAASCQAGSCLSIRELITERVVDPLDLTNTLYPVGTEWGTTQHTNGTWNLQGTLSDFTETTPSVPNSAGAMISNVEDQLTWLVEATTNAQGTLSPETFALRLENTTDLNGMVGIVEGGYGLGIYGQDSLETGAFMLGHGGELSGYQTLMFKYPGDLNTDEDDLFIVSNINTFLNYSDERKFLLSDINDVYYDFQKTIGIYDAYRQNPDGCTSDAVGTTCTSTTVAVTQMQVADAFTIEPSGAFWAGTTIALPTYVFYGEDNTGVTAQDANVVVQEGAILEGYGNSITLLQLEGTANTVDVRGTITTTGADTVAIDASSASSDTINIATTGSVDGQILATQGADMVHLNGVVEGDIALGTSARIDGTGTVLGMVSGAGTTAPGAMGDVAPSTMTVSRFEPTDGTLEINVSGGSASADLLNVVQQMSSNAPVPDTGIAILDNTTLRLTGTPLYGEFLIPILSTDIALENQFAQIEDPSGLLEANGTRLKYNLVYTPKEVFLSSTSPAVFDGIAAASYADSLTVLDQSLGYSLANAQRGATRPTGFARSLGMAASVSNQDGIADFQIGSLGLLGGIGGPFADGGYYELAVAQTEANASLDNNGGRQKVDMMSAGLSLGFALGTLDMAVSVFYGEGDVEYRRLTGSGVARASTDQKRWGAIIGAGKTTEHGEWETAWRSSLAYFHVEEDAFTETASSAAALSFDERAYDRVRLGVGVKSQRKQRDLTLSPWVSGDIFYHADTNSSDIQFDSVNGSQTLEARPASGFEIKFGTGVTYKTPAGALVSAGVTAGKRNSSVSVQFDTSLSFDF